ncbi:MAG: ATP-dependent DNA helicase RecG, partial [Hyphomicrobiales bacterium]|nr:ATP-dependent DNA helicase RecG [Hyphomicrobiales bacterium]
MRPEILFPLFQDASTLAGVGQRTASALEKRTGRRLLDVCWLLPQGLIDRGHRPPVGMLRPGDIATLKVQVSEHAPPRHRSQPYVVHCFDETGEIDLVFFHMKPRYLLERLPVGETRFVSGRVDFYRKRAQMHHPAYIVEPEALEQLPLLETIYPSALGVGARVLRKAVASALEKVPELPEWLDEGRLRSHRWLDWRGALLSAHAPQNLAELEPDAPARKRLAYDELLANQLALGVIRAHHRKRRGRALAGGAELRERTVKSLPWNLTAAQQRVLREIEADMESPYPMLRLLQGDVGSGKTIVAFLSMLGAVGSGAQAAFMAPTELLARQH